MDHRNVVYGPSKDNPPDQELFKLNPSSLQTNGGFCKDFCFVFVRIKADSHCLEVNHITKRHIVLWFKNNCAIIRMQKIFYECEKNWLITHPLLSCYTEIQLINLKS